jgi:guanylate kinase
VNGPRRGIPFVAAAPSGTGKTTVCRGALELDENLRFSVSHTTRTPRPGEVDGADYHFVSTETFRHMVERGEFVEHAEYAGNLYGTSGAALREPLDQGFDLMIEIEVQGARQLRDRLPDARFLFLLPPSMAELERRLRARGTDGDEAIEHRLALVGRELAAVDFFDYAIVNDDLPSAVEAMLTVVRAERAGTTEAVRERFGREAVVQRNPGLFDRQG